MRRQVLAAFLTMIPVFARAQTVNIDPRAAHDGGVKVASLPLVRFAPARSGYGMVGDTAGLIALRGALLEAAAHERLTRATLTRAAQLYHAGRNVSVASLEQAQAAQASAEARLATLRARLISEYGAALADQLARSSGPGMALVLGKASLIEVSVAAPILPSVPAQATARSDHGPAVALTLIGPAGHVPTGLVSQGLYYLGPLLPAGMPLAVRLPIGPSRAGYIVPRSALIYRDHHPAFFQETAPGRFAITSLATAAVVRSDGCLRGYFIRHALLPHGGPIAVAGAGLLLSMTARLSGGDKD